MTQPNAPTTRNVYTDVQKQIADDLAKRATVQRAAVAKINTQRRLFADGPPLPLIIVADGDSWFDYPLPPFTHTDVADSLTQIGTPSPKIMKLAHYGDATTALLGVIKRNRLIDYLSDPDNGPIDVIMFSGGGNDLVGDQFRFWLLDAAAVANNPANAVNIALLNDVLAVVSAAYLDLIRIRDQYAANAILLLHAYDFAIPTNVPACLFAGPWLHPSLADRGWNDLAEGTAIVRAILTTFRQKLVDICTANRNVILVETQGTLSAAQWANELHPDPAGFDAIAAKFRAALQAQQAFKNRI